MSKRKLFTFWQFNGDNKSWCNFKCPYCYGGPKEMKHYWNGDVKGWEQAFERLNRDIYFVFSYGEAMGSHGFYECVDMIGEHPSWTLNIITNLSFSPERLIQSRLGREKRVFITACWHPLGVPDRVQAWEKFKKHLLMLKEAEIPVHVMMVWYKPQIRWFPEYFEWLDRHDIRIGVRRFIYPRYRTIKKIPIVRNWRWFIGKGVLENYTEAERGYLYAYTCPKVTKYSLDLASSRGRLCTAGKDMILVKCDGTVALCADCCGRSFVLGNVFDENYKLSEELVRCPTHTCGGDYGMLHLVDERFGSLPKKLWNDTFISQVENIPQGSPVPYKHRVEMLKWLEVLKRENSLS